MTRFWTAICLTALGLGACTSTVPSAGDPDSGPAPCTGLSCEPPDEQPVTPGTNVTLEITASDRSALEAFESELAPMQSATAQTLLDAHPVPFDDALDYDPKTAAGMDLIQASPLALDPVELEKLGQQGFAISARQKFPNMAYGLKTIYASDLPVYISIDPILDAVHNSYDTILKYVEQQMLMAELQDLLRNARQRNAEVTADPQVKKDLDFYFTVAMGLLNGAPIPPIAGGDAALSNMYVQKGIAAKGIEETELFGVKRNIDFSQFTPRGHYTDSPALTRYFHTMMWLGRIEFRLIETTPKGERIFHRRQLNAMLAMRDVVQGVAAEAFNRIDAVVTAFVGEHDYMELREVDLLLADLGATSAADVANLADQQIAQTIIEKGYGAQRILSQVIFKDPSTTGVTLPIDRSFALLGQRYVVDSHVFSAVTYDRVIPSGTHEIRLLPNPLDAAYAALGNSAALPLLRPDLERHGHAPQLERMRKVVDEHESAFWEQNLYNIWLSALRAMSPAEAPADAALPSVARTERWSRRVLSTQLASWAQLRHDTILYAKQSYTAGSVCEFPDAYVEPYPEFFHAIARFAERGLLLADELDPAQSTLAERVAAYFTNVRRIAELLAGMAELQRTGMPHSAEQIAFINQAIRIEAGGSGPPMQDGWYRDLFFDPSLALEFDPTIADVHTDPGGDTPILRGPSVLHVGTGYARALVVSIDTCEGPRAYAGVVHSFYEYLEPNLNRLTDEIWSGEVRFQPAAEPWLAPVLP